MTNRMVLLAATVLLLPCLAMASTVTFSTTGTFSNPSLFPISFTGVTNQSTPGGFVSFGTFSVGTCAGTCAGHETFTLTINQTAPKVGSGNIDVTLNGSVVGSSSHIKLTFKTATVLVGGTTYSIPFHESITFGSNATTLNGNVVASEPNAQLLLGLGTLGLVGLTLVSRKGITN
jgi:hypothetical protein